MFPEANYLISVLLWRKSFLKERFTYRAVILTWYWNGPRNSHNVTSCCRRGQELGAGQWGQSAHTPTCEHGWHTAAYDFTLGLNPNLMYSLWLFPLNLPLNHQVYPLRNFKSRGWICVPPFTLRMRFVHNWWNVSLTWIMHMMSQWPVDSMQGKTIGSWLVRAADGWLCF